MLEQLSARQLTLIKLLEERLSSGNLPGWSAQKKMSPIRHSIHPKTPDSAIEASVFCLLRPLENESFNLVYIKRSSKYPGDKHKGQISFPGGKKEKEDIDRLACGLRETEEEVGIDQSQIKVLGSLSPFYIFVSGFIAFPFVGLIPKSSQFVPDPDEVDYIIEIDIETLFSDENRKTREYQFRETLIKESPYYGLHDDILWGATAIMTSELDQIWQEIR